MTKCFDVPFYHKNGEFGQRNILVFAESEEDAKILAQEKVKNWVDDNWCVGEIFSVNKGVEHRLNQFNK